MTPDYYIYSRSEDEWHDESIEEAAQDAVDNMSKEELKTATEVTLYRGEPKHADFSDFFCVDSLIETMQINAYDNYGEHSEGYLEDVTEEHKKELERLILEWAQKSDFKVPTFYLVNNVKKVKHPITEDMKP